jgi:hypothetical protein
LIKPQKSTDIHLEAPHLSDKTHSNRPNLEASNNITRKKISPKIIDNKDLIDPCNGHYKKTNGTTCGLKEIIIGRCYEYQHVKYGFSLTNRS